MLRDRSPLKYHSALAYCKGKSAQQYNAADMHVRVCEYIRKPTKGTARKPKVTVRKANVAARNSKVKGRK